MRALPRLRVGRPGPWTWRLLVAGMLAVYAVASFWPFEWQPPQKVANGAELIPPIGVRFAAPGLARSPEAPGWIAAARRSGELDVSLRIRPFSARQYGPARIVTLSDSVYMRNFTVGQEGGDLIVRLRTPETGANGSMPGGGPLVTVRDVFDAPGWTEIGLHARSEQIQVEVDGELLASTPLGQAPFRDWSLSYPIVLGNELSGNRPWLGRIERAEVGVADAVVDYADPRAIELPPSFWLIPESPKLEPFLHFNLRDSINNLILYVPLGVFLGIGCAGRGWRSGARALLPIAALSVSVEFLQVFFADRVPTLDDVIFNSLGGALGIAIALPTRRWLVRVLPSPSGP